MFKIGKISVPMFQIHSSITVHAQLHIWHRKSCMLAFAAQAMFQL